MTGARLSHAQLAGLRTSLHARDWMVMATLHRVRLATAGQLERLHWTDVTAVSRSRQRRRALGRLVSLRVLTRLERRIGGVRAGSDGFAYTLDVAGQRLLNGGGPAGGSRVRRPWTPGMNFVAHTLAVTELYVNLRELEHEGVLDLIAFATEPACWRSFAGPGGGRLTLKPDAVVRIGVGDFLDSYFIEVDRGTVSPTTLSHKLTLYRRYWQSGREQAAHDVFPRVLWTVPDERRRAVLVEVIGRQPADSWQLYQVAVFEEAIQLMAGRQS